METKDKLSKEFDYFKANLSKLYAQYPDKFLIMKDKQVQGFADTFSKAYELAILKFELDTFIIQKCNA